MKLILPRSKPSLAGHTVNYSLCSFRTSKLYLWSLVNLKLAEISSMSSFQVRVLDAACHSLIARSIFPNDFIYYGLDISRQRLKQALSLKEVSDHLYLADLTKPLNVNSCFHVVVSLNTFSHLPADQRFPALSNLIASCLPGADFILNVPIDSSLMLFSQKLLNSFDSLEVTYFDSFLSKSMEAANEINSSNISTLLSGNELSLPNDASLHSQALLHARSCTINSTTSSLPPSSLNTYLPINNVPIVDRYDFSDDEHFISQCSEWSPDSVILFTDFLFTSHYGKRLASLVRSSCSLNTYSLVDFQPSIDFSGSIYIVGLESEWIGDPQFARLSLNRFRELPSIKSLIYVVVQSRNGNTCVPSVVSFDA